MNFFIFMLLLLILLFEILLNIFKKSTSKGFKYNKFFENKYSIMRHKYCIF